MIIDKQGKLFGKISIVDIFIILVIILASVILFLKVSTGATSGGEASPVTYTVKVEGIRKTSEKYFKPGLPVYNDKGEYMGEIVKISNKKDAVTYNKLSNGDYVETTNPTRSDIEVVIKANATKNDKGVYIDGKISLLVGMEKYFEIEDTNFVGTVIYIE